MGVLLQVFLPLSLAFIMFSLGLGLTLADFARVFKQPRAFVAGVIAQIIGTKAVLDPQDAAMIAGLLINKFRGDVSLFQPALQIIRDHTGLESYGIVTYWPGAHRLPAEDGVALEKAGRYVRAATGEDSIRIAVPHLPRIANFDDLDPLAAEPDVELLIIKPGEIFPADIDLVLLPGSKSTLADLRFLKEQGWDIDILAHHRRGGHVIGICGGYQMLGRAVHDPNGVEGAAGSELGLGLLDVETTMGGDKTLRQTTGSATTSVGAMGVDIAVNGYEIHMGETTGQDVTRGVIQLNDGRQDGVLSEDGHVLGTYLHGLFDHDQAFVWLMAGNHVAIHALGFFGEEFDEGGAIGHLAT